MAEQKHHAFDLKRELAAGTIKVVFYPLDNTVADFWKVWATRDGHEKWSTLMGGKTPESVALETKIGYTYLKTEFELVGVNLLLHQEMDPTQKDVVDRGRQQHVTSADAFIVMGESKFLTPNCLKNITEVCNPGSVTPVPLFFFLTGPEPISKTVTILSKLLHEKKTYCSLSSQITNTIVDDVLRCIFSGLFNRLEVGNDFIFDLSTPSSFTVTITRGIGLVARDFGGTSDPFCEFGVGTNLSNYGPKQKTKTKSSTLDPVWGKGDKNSKAFPYSKINNLYIEIWDKDRIGKDKMGFCQIPISQLKVGINSLEVKPYKKEKVSGTIEIDISFE